MVKARARQSPNLENLETSLRTSPLTTRKKPQLRSIYAPILSRFETKVYLMLPTDADEVKVDGCGVFEGMLTQAEAETPTAESWIDTQVEQSDKRDEF